MREDHGLLGVNAAGKIVNDHVIDVVGNMLGGVAVSNDLVVGDDYVGVYAKVLQAHALNDGAKVMTQVQSARRTISGKHGVVSGMFWQICLNLI